MCGYIGKLSLEQIDKENIYGSNKRIICRGPDDKNFINFNLNQFNCSFIFNRLSILDLTSANQPMESHSKLSIIMFNGEIYNHDYLRDKLKKTGQHFKTKNSDTEVILNGLEHFGVDFVKN